MKKIVLLAAFSILISSCEDESFDVNPIAMFTCEVDGYNAIFKNLSGYFEEYAWDFGDGSSATGIAISHVYAAKGEYSVTLTAKTLSKLTTNGNQMVTTNYYPLLGISKIGKPFPMHTRIRPVKEGHCAV